MPFKHGKLEIWAISVIYGLAQINLLFDKSFDPYLSADDMCNYFKTKKNQQCPLKLNLLEIY